MNDNKGKYRMNKNKKDNNKNKESANKTGKATPADIIKLKEHFDKKFGRS